MVVFYEQVRVWVEQMVLALGYPGLFALMFLEGVFPPIPSEVVLPFAGSLAQQGRLNFALIVVAGTLGSLLVALLYYGLGRWLEARGLRRLVQRYGRWLLLTEQDWDRAMRLFRRYGEGLVFAGRLVPGLRSLVSIPAGLHRLPLARFLLLTALGSAAWNALLAWVGFLLGANWSDVLAALDRYGPVGQATLAAAAGLLAVKLVADAYRARRAPERESLDG